MNALNAFRRIYNIRVLQLSRLWFFREQCDRLLHVVFDERYFPRAHVHAIFHVLNLPVHGAEIGMIFYARVTPERNGKKTKNKTESM